MSYKIFSVLVILLYTYLYGRIHNNHYLNRNGLGHYSTNIMSWTTIIPALIILSIAFVLMNIGLLIKSRPLEKRCSDEGCDCDCN